MLLILLIPFHLELQWENKNRIVYRLDIEDLLNANI